MKWYGREVSPTLAGGNDTGGWMCSGIVAGGLVAVHVLTANEGQMATGGMFIEPQLPVTHLRATQGKSVVPGNKANRVLAYSRRSVGGGRRLVK